MSGDMGGKLLNILLVGLFMACVPIGASEFNHFLLQGLSPFLGSIVTFCFILLLALGIRLSRRWVGFTLPDWFLAGCVSWLLWGVEERVFMGNSTLDIQLHETYFIIAHAHIGLAMTVVFGAMAFIYHLYPKIVCRGLQPTMGAIHFWVSYLGSWIVCFVIPRVQYSANMPRHYWSYEGVYVSWYDLNLALLWTGNVVLAAQVLFFINMIYSGFRGRRVG